MSLSLILGGTASADTRQRDSERINTTTPIFNNYYAGGDTVTIDTTIAQDAWLMGSTINIGGSIQQDATIFGNNIMIRGRVNGDLRIFGNTVQIFGPISGDVVIVASTIEVGNGVSIGGSVKLYASTIIYNGSTQGELFMNTQNLMYNGKSQGETTIITNTINIQSGSSINNNLSYRTPQKNPSLEALVTNGQATYTQTLQHYSLTTSLYHRQSRYVVFWLCFVIIMSLVLYHTLRRPIEIVSQTLARQSMSSLVAGGMIMLLTPIIAAILSITIIGIPLAIILMMAYLSIVLVYQIAVVVIITQLIRQQYFSTSSAKDQFATICTLISLAGVVTIIGWFSLIGGLFVIGAVRQTCMIRK